MDIYFFAAVFITNLINSIFLGSKLVTLRLYRAIDLPFRVDPTRFSPGSIPGRSLI